MLATELKEFKRSHGLTWLQVSKLCNVTLAACYHWQNETRKIPGTVDRLLAICDKHPHVIKTVLPDL